VLFPRSSLTSFLLRLYPNETSTAVLVGGASPVNLNAQLDRSDGKYCTTNYKTNKTGDLEKVLEIFRDDGRTGKICECRPGLEVVRPAAAIHHKSEQNDHQSVGFIRTQAQAISEGTMSL